MPKRKSLNGNPESNGRGNEDSEDDEVAFEFLTATFMQPPYTDMRA
jgi:hypothetical protein